MQPYSGIRILDLTHWLGSYAGRLFADLGAEVIRVEPPEGLADRRNAGDGAFAFLNASKSSVTVTDTGAAGYDEFAWLASAADVVFLERDGPFWDKAEELRDTLPQLVVTCVSPYGRTGPLKDAPASDLTIQSAGGIAWMSGRIDDAPLRLPYGQAAMVCGIYAAVATSICLRDAGRRQRGHFVDVSAQECIAHSLQNAIQVWDLEQRISTRGGEGTRDATENVFPCKDGYVFFAAPPSIPKAFQGLIDWMNEVGHPSGPALEDPRWKDQEWRKTAEARAAFSDLLCAFTTNLTKGEFRDEAVARKLIATPVCRFPDLLDDPQLVFRKFFGRVDGHLFPGAPYALSEPVWKASGPPRLGAERKEVAS